MKIAIICDPIDLDQKTWIPVYCENLIKNIIKLDKKNEYIFFHMKKNILLKGQKEVIIPNSTKNNFLNSFYMILKKFIIIPLFLYKNKVTTIFDLTPFLFSKYHESINVRWNKFFLWKTLKKTDKILTISENTKKDIVKIFPFFKKENIITTYLWTNILNIKEDKSIKYDFPFILSVWTLEPRKNLIILIKAFIELKEKKNIQEKLILVWKKWWKIQWLFEELKLNKKYSSDIILTWFISNEQLLHLYKTCKVFVYPSLYEWFWLPVLEAMSVWAPVITSNKSSLPEVVGENWTTINPNSYKDLKEKLYLILYSNEDRNSNIKNWLKRAKLFSWEKCAKDTIKVYEDLYTKK